MKVQIQQKANESFENWKNFDQWFDLTKIVARDPSEDLANNARNHKFKTILQKVIETLKKVRKNIVLLGTYSQFVSFKCEECG